MAWQKVTEIKKQELWSLVPPEWNIEALPSPTQQPNAHLPVSQAISFQERQITARTTNEILEALKCGDLSAQEVLQAFAHRAIVAHQYTTCLCENNFASARKRAQELDAHWRAHHAPIGALHGLPISVMDRFHLAGLDSACGFASWVGAKRAAEDEGSLVRSLRTLGAIVVCKTNVPMSMMLGETANNIIGITVNPYNRQLSAGGACGGESALVSLQASCIGFGTDIAAAFCGLYALKCSEGRLPQDGIATVLPGLPVASGSIGLLSKDLAGIATVLKAFLESPLDTRDPDLLQISWRRQRYDFLGRRKGSPEDGDGRLVFGLMTDDGYVRPHPPIQRALALLTSALRQAGHEVVGWNPPAHGPAAENLFKILGSTSAIKAREALDASGEPTIPQIADWYKSENTEPNTTTDFCTLCEQLFRYRAQYKSYWNSVGELTGSGREPDGIVMPVAPTLAVRHGEFRYYGYSAIANVLDYPSGAFPVTFGDRELDVANKDLEIFSPMDREVQETYHIEDIHGLPVALQVMCPRLHEENVLILMEAIKEALGFANRTR